MTLHPITTEVITSEPEDALRGSIAPLVRLKDGEDQPPLFLAHGIGGSAMDFSSLVKHIRLSHPIYAMEAI